MSSSTHEGWDWLSDAEIDYNLRASSFSSKSSARPNNTTSTAPSMRRGRRIEETASFVLVRPGLSTDTHETTLIEETQVLAPDSTCCSCRSSSSSSSNNKSKLCIGLFTLLLLFLLLASVLCVLYLTDIIDLPRFHSNNNSPPNLPIAQPPPSNITVGVYYYPWYGKNFHGRRYLREHLHQLPVLGEYDDTDPAVIGQHLEWSRQHNIRLWVTSWWGPNLREDATVRNIVLPHPRLGSHQIAVFYETTGRIKDTTTDLEQRVRSDIDFLCRHYFQHPNYLRIRHRPVLFIYLTRKLEVDGVLEQVVSTMRRTAAAAKCGEDIFLVGDHVWKEAPPPPPGEGGSPPVFTQLDAVTGYDIYGQLAKPHGNLHVGYEALEGFQKNQIQWKRRANQYGCGFIPSCSPGFNDRGVRLEEADHLPLSRKITPNSDEGSLFRESLIRARSLVDDTMDNILMVNSWNEFHEDTQIEPMVGPSSREPQQLTMGLEYRGYGDLYLQILRNETVANASVIGDVQQ